MTYFRKLAFWKHRYPSRRSVEGLKNLRYSLTIWESCIQYSRHNSWNNGILSCSRLWAEFKYWNSSKEYITKSSQFNQTYKDLSKWIKKNTRVSICKHYYIGEQAYHLYKQNKLRMAAGPKNFIEFKL